MEVEKASGAARTPFSSSVHLYGFVALVLAGQAVNMMPFGATLSSQYEIAKHFGVQDQPGHVVWIVAAYSLTAAAFVLPGGRLCDLYGAGRVWQASVAWMAIWTLAAGFAPSAPVFDAFRALAGISSGVLLPAGVSLLAQYYPPGTTRALVFGLFGALAPFSAAGGSIFETMLAQLTSTPWIWHLLAIKTFLLFVASFLALPKSSQEGYTGTFDIVGCLLGCSGLILFNFSFCQASLVGWSSAQVITTLPIGLLLLLSFVLWELYGTNEPILPMTIWKAPTFPWLMFSAFLGFMSFGVWVIHYSQLVLKVRQASPLLTQAYWTPFTLGAFCAAIISGQLTRVLPAQAIFFIGFAALILSNALSSVMPATGTYWTYPFLSACFAALGPDLLFTASQIISSNTVGQAEQGVAGSLVGTTLNFALAWGAALGGLVAEYTNEKDPSGLHGLHGAFYFGASCAAVGALVVMCFVRIKKDTREGY